MKKFTSIILLVFTMIFMLMSVGCGKRATKEQAVEQRTKLAAWYESEDFKKLVLPFFNEDGTMKDEAGMEKALKAAESSKIDEIVKSMGFQNQEEFKATDDVLNSPEVKNADKMLEERVKTAVVKIATELVTKKMAEEAQKLDIPAN